MTGSVSDCTATAPVSKVLPSSLGNVFPASLARKMTKHMARDASSTLMEMPGDPACLAAIEDLVQHDIDGH